MPTIDYALAYDFVEPADPTVPYRLEFRYPFTPGKTHAPTWPTRPASSSPSSKAASPAAAT